MEKTFDLDIPIGANWSVTSGIHYLRIANYQGKVCQLNDGHGPVSQRRWEWFVAFNQGFISMPGSNHFDHGTADDLEAAKLLAQLAIQAHNQHRRIHGRTL